MAIKEPVFVYRKYQVTPHVEYIPCLPITDLDFPTCTRIPRGAELTFMSKYDNELVRIAFHSAASKEEYHVVAMLAAVCENVLPLYRRST
jgi:hypothetical protein